MEARATRISELWIACAMAAPLLALGEPATKPSPQPEVLLFSRDSGLNDWTEEQHDFFKAKNPNIQTWSVKEGVLRCDGSRGNCGFLRYRERLADFTLSLDYRMSPGCNSGVGIRSAVPYTTLNPNTLPSQVGFEIQIRDDAGKQPSNQSTGAFYGVLAPRVNAARPAGQWNHLEITCQGWQIRVVLNGQVVQDVDQTKDPRLSNRPTSGYLSFQNHGHDTEFRNVRLTVLQTKSKQ